MNLLFLLLLLLLPSVTRAEEMCSPGQAPAVCVIIEQRNNALSELANVEGARREEVSKSVRVASYWHHYVAGLPDVAVMKSEMAKVCAWRGTPTQPEAHMCAWYRQSFPAAQPAWRGKR